MKTELVKKFAYTPHRNERVRRWFPDEIEVGWQFTDDEGKSTFVKWGSTKNRDTLKPLIAEVLAKHGQMEVVEL
jgi:hypothetical protein